MFKEKPLYLFGRVPDYIKYLLWVLPLLLSAQIVVRSWLWLGAVYAPLFFYLKALKTLSRSEKAVGFMTARRGTVALICVSLTLLILVPLSIYYIDRAGNDPFSLGAFSPSSTPYSAAPHIVAGVALGALIGYCFSILMTLALLGKRRLGMSVITTTVWTVGIFIFPWYGPHQDIDSYYVLGISFGIFLSHIFRLRLTRAFSGVQDTADVLSPKAGAILAELEAPGSASDALAAAKEAEALSHVFISYVRDNEIIVDRLCRLLKSEGINVWLDRDQIKPGQRWKTSIRNAIRDGAHFIACFSEEYAEKGKTYMNEELNVAIEELRQMPEGRAWFLPVLISKCQIPDRTIGAGETLSDIQWINLYEDWDAGVRGLIQVINSDSRSPSLPGQTVMRSSRSENPLRSDETKGRRTR